MSRKAIAFAVIAGGLLVCGILYLSWTANPRMVEVGWMPRWLSRWADAHDQLRTAVPFFLLAGLIGGVGRLKKFGYGFYGVAWIGLTGLVTAVEVGQLGLPRRVFDGMDIFWGSVGAGAGLGVAVMGIWIFNRIFGTMMKKDIGTGEDLGLGEERTEVRGPIEERTEVRGPAGDLGSGEERTEVLGPIEERNEFRAPEAFYFLGLRFWNGETDALLREMDLNGGMLAVPSAPSLAQAAEDPLLNTAYRSSDWSVMDGGYVALIVRAFGKSVRRISGLQLIEKITAPANVSSIALRDRKILWVLPSEDEGKRIETFLESAWFDAAKQHYYLAPFYRTDEDFKDAVLLAKVREWQPDWIVLCLGGGRQEKLGYYLRTSNVEDLVPSDQLAVISGLRGTLNIERPTLNVEDLVPSDQLAVISEETGVEGGTRRNGPVILCTGAAIAFFTGGQAKIPTWADRMYLGWFLRIMENPKAFVPRYVKAGWHFPLALWQQRGTWFDLPK